MINDLAKHTVSSDTKDKVVAEKRFKTMCLNDSVSLARHAQEAGAAAAQRPERSAAERRALTAASTA